MKQEDIDPWAGTSIWLLGISLLWAFAIAALFHMQTGRWPDAGLVIALIVAAVFAWGVARANYLRGLYPIRSIVVLFVLWLLWFFMADFTGIMVGE
ncbi:MAG: hypothetical protein H7243_01950 [Sphingomonadaceae bacterium]|nr:hypothetical protein [Sphingomonadaceae bacterium]